MSKSRKSPRAEKIHVTMPKGIHEILAVRRDVQQSRTVVILEKQLIDPARAKSF